jgi:hypothetical protein
VELNVNNSYRVNSIGQNLGLATNKSLENVGQQVSRFRHQKPIRQRPLVTTREPVRPHGFNAKIPQSHKKPRRKKEDCMVQSRKSNSIRAVCRNWGYLELERDRW